MYCPLHLQSSHASLHSTKSGTLVREIPLDTALNSFTSSNTVFLWSMKYLCQSQLGSLLLWWRECSMMCGLFLVPKLQQFLFPLSPVWLLNGSAFDADLLFWPKEMGCGYGTCLLSVLQAVCFLSLSLSHGFHSIVLFHPFIFILKKKYIWAQTHDCSVCGAYHDSFMPGIDVAEVLCTLYSFKKSVAWQWIWPRGTWQLKHKTLWEKEHKPFMCDTDTNRTD